MLINKKTQTLIKAFIAQPSSSLIVEGGENSGHEDVVSMLISELLSSENKNNILTISPQDGKVLGVELIRDLKKSLTTKVGGDSVGRVAVVYRAEKMTKEAQNSLLKFLEEPTHNTVVILLTKHAGTLLQTIRSRCQLIKVLPITQVQAAQFAKEHGIDQSTHNKAFLLSGGAALLYEQIVSGKNTAVLDQISNAKEFLSLSVFERIARQKEYAKVDALEGLLTGLQTACEAAMHASQQRGVERWKNLVAETKECQELLVRSVPIKLIYLKLCVNL